MPVQQREKRRGQPNLAVRLGLAMWWVVAAIGLAQTSPQPAPQTPPQNPPQNPPQASVPAPVPGTQRSTTLAPTPVTGRPSAAPPVVRPARTATPRRASTYAGQTSAMPIAVTTPAAAAPGPVQTPLPPDPPPPYPVAARILPPRVDDAPPPPDIVPTPIAVADPSSGKKKKSFPQRLVASSPNLAQNSLNAYVERLRRETSNAQPTPGSIWTESGRLTRLNTDVRAMRPNDLIQVVVSESLAASTDGTVKNQRASTANSSISSLIGALHASNALQNLVNQSSTGTLNAQGASATNSSLTTTFGGQVIEVLPNGMLVIEAARQVEFSQQTQTIILRGLVRPEDISQQNQIKSTAISSLELEVKGKGIVNDYTRRQNPIVRLLQQILIF